MPQRVYWHHYLGLMPPNTKCVNRSSRWGNQFAMPPKGHLNREQAIWLWERFARWYAQQRPDWITPLRGFDLACSCWWGQACHADVLLELANQS